MKTVKTITAEQIKKIQSANEAVVGTRQYSKYYMERETKSGSRWIFMGCSYPHLIAPAIYKKFKGKEYLIQGDARYTLTPEVKELIFEEE